MIRKLNYFIYIYIYIFFTKRFYNLFFNNASVIIVSEFILINSW